MRAIKDFNNEFNRSMPFVFYITSTSSTILCVPADDNAEDSRLTLYSLLIFSKDAPRTSTVLVANRNLRPLAVYS
jgi:hypothetical protein